MKKLIAIWFACALTAVAGTVVINTFNAGELSPHMDARVDFAKYRSGCRTLENFIPLPYGGVLKRPGTEYVTSTKSNATARLLSMSIGVDQSYAIEMGDEAVSGGYLRFFANEVQILDTNSEPYELYSPYASNDLFSVQTAQNGDTMYFMHPDYPVWKLTRLTTDPTFTFEPVEWDYPPLLEENDTETEIWVQVTNLTVVSFKNGAGYKYELAGAVNGKNDYRYALDHNYSGYTWDGSGWVFWFSSYPDPYDRAYSTNDTVSPTDATNWNLRTYGAGWQTNFTDVVTNTTTVFDGRIGYASFNASSNIWTSNHVGSVWQISHPRTNNRILIHKDIDGAYTSTPVLVKGTWKLLTQGDWDGRVIIQVSEDDRQTWTDYRTYISDGTSGVNYDREGEETESGVYYRIIWEEDSVSQIATDDKLSFHNEDEYQDCLFEITGFNSASSVYGRIYTDYPLSATNATRKWSEAAFSDERGHPRTGTFYENRLWLAGTQYEVNSLWASKTDGYDDFEVGIYDDSGMKLTLASDNIIQWLEPRNTLFLGTMGGEWTLSGGDSATPLTPETANARQQSSFGSKRGSSAISASDAVMYFQRMGRKLRRLEYSFEADQYKSPDVTILAEHILESGVVQFAQQQEPQPIVWCVRSDGQLAALTYSAEQNVFAWHRHITDGAVESVCVLPSDGEDVVYLIVRRTINSETRRYVEVLKPHDWGNQDDAWFVDSGLAFDGGDAIDVSAVTVNSGTVTVTAANSYSNGWDVEFSGVSGMTELENYTFGVTNATASNFVLTVGGSYADGSTWNTYTGTGTVQRVENTFTNVSHLEGETLAVFADGSVIPSATVTNGVLTISDYKNRVIAGLPYTAKLSPMHIDVYAESGNSYGLKKQPYRIRFRLNESGRFQYGSRTNDLYQISIREPSLPVGSAVPFYTGDTEEYSLNATYSTEPEIWVWSAEPLPVGILSMVIFTDIKEIE